MKKIHVVDKQEHHHLPTCPCAACTRERRRLRGGADKSSIKLTPEDAYLLGYINSRSPAGSLARQLQLQHN